jgi:hypothetical protein
MANNRRWDVAWMVELVLLLDVDWMFRQEFCSRCCRMWIGCSVKILACLVIGYRLHVETHGAAGCWLDEETHDVAGCWLDVPCKILFTLEHPMLKWLQT